MQQALLLHVEFKSDFEYSKREYSAVLTSFQRWAKPCMHGKRSVCFVILTQETAAELVKRLRPTLDSNTADYRCHPAPIAVVARHGSVDSLVTQVTAVHREIGERRYSKNVGDRQFFRSKRSIDDSKRSTVVQVPVKPGGPGKPTKNLDGE